MAASVQVSVFQVPVFERETLLLPLAPFLVVEINICALEQTKNMRDVRIEPIDNKNNGVFSKQLERLPKVDPLKYFGSTIQAEGGCEKNVTNRIRSGWDRWREMPSVIHDKVIEIYKIAITQAIMYCVN